MKPVFIFFYICIGLYSSCCLSADNAETSEVEQQGTAKKIELGKFSIYRKDYKKAYDLFMQAHKEGSTDAAYYLAAVYANAYGVEKDLELAKKWYLIAAKEGHNKAQYELGVLFNLELRKDKSNYYRAKHWFQKAADGGNDDAKNDLAVLYAQNKQYKLAYNLVKDAENSGHAPSLFTLSQFYLFGLGVNKSTDKALSLLGKSAHDGYLAAILNLSKLYKSSQDVPQDEIKSLKYDALAYEQHKHYASGLNVAIAYLKKDNMAKAQPILIDLVKNNYLPAKRLVKKMTDYKDSLLKKN